MWIVVYAKLKKNKISPLLHSYITEAKMLKNDCPSMISCLLQQVIDHNFGGKPQH